MVCCPWSSTCAVHPCPGAYGSRVHAATFSIIISRYAHCSECTGPAGTVIAHWKGAHSPAYTAWRQQFCPCERLQIWYREASSGYLLLCIAPVAGTTGPERHHYKPSRDAPTVSHLHVKDYWTTNPEQVPNWTHYAWFRYTIDLLTCTVLAIVCMCSKAMNNFY
jgi:hypothetical protein